MKSMWPPLVAIFFMTYFYRTGGGMAPLTPLAPLDPQLDLHIPHVSKYYVWKLHMS